MRRKVTYFFWNILAGRAKNVTARRFFRAMPRRGRRYALDESPTREGQVANLRSSCRRLGELLSATRGNGGGPDSPHAAAYFVKSNK